ncbi:MAG: hypothetical protein QXU74_01500 [Candidatus Aenigmatarchaeota archaeon]
MVIGWYNDPWLFKIEKIDGNPHLIEECIPYKICLDHGKIVRIGEREYETCDGSRFEIITDRVWKAYVKTRGKGIFIPHPYGEYFYFRNDEDGSLLNLYIILYNIMERFPKEMDDTPANRAKWLYENLIDEG